MTRPPRMTRAMLLLGLGMALLGGCPAEDDLLSNPMLRSPSPGVTPSSNTSPGASPSSSTSPGASPSSSTIPGGIPTLKPPTPTPSGGATAAPSPTLAPITTPIPQQ